MRLEIFLTAEYTLSNPFVLNALFLYLLKTSERVEKGAMGTNGLKITSHCYVYWSVLTMNSQVTQTSTNEFGGEGQSMK